MAPEVQDPKKLLKIVNCQNCQKTILSQSKKVGGHRYPPGSVLYGILDFLLSVPSNIKVNLFHKVIIQVDIGGHPPFPTGSKQFSGNFGNLLFLAGFNFRGHFEGPNECFLISRFSMISKWTLIPQNEYPRRYLSSELSRAPNENRMPKLRPREVDTPNYPKQCPKNCWILIF